MITPMFLFGTDHRYQCGGRDCEPEKAEIFKAELRAFCQTYNIRRLAEEMTIDGRRNYQVNITNVETLANELQITHQEVDLNVADRELIKLGDSAMLNGLSVTKFKDGGGKFRAAFGQVSNDIRERVWASRILSSNPWPVLFVLGADHVKSFRRIAHRLGIESAIIYEDYAP